MEENGEPFYGETISSEERSVSLKALQQRDSYRGVLAIDQYAETLMNELGVVEMVSVAELGAKLASATTRKKRPGFVEAQQLSKNWKIGLEAAKRTVDATTQLAVRDFTTTTGGRRLKPYHWLMDQKRLSCPVYSDVVFGKCKSLRGNTCASVYATTFNYVRAKAMKSKKECHFTLDDFFEKIGVPLKMVTDGAKEFVQGDFSRKCKKAQCPQHQVEVDTANANTAETVIRELKRHYRRVMLDTNAPEVLWDYCLEWCALIRSHTAINIKQLDGKVPATKITGDTVDISHLAEFGWYDWVWFVDTKCSNVAGLEETGEPSMRNKRLGKYLGPAENVGSAMCGTVLTELGSTLDRTSIFPLSLADKNSEQVNAMKHKFKSRLGEKLKERVAGMKAGKDAEQLE